LRGHVRLHHGASLNHRSAVSHSAEAFAAPVDPFSTFTRRRILSKPTTN
jgi:hypothetical protein